MVTPTGVVVLTDRRSAVLPLVDVIGAAVAGGARWVLLRERDLPAGRRRDLAEQLRAMLEPVGGRLIVAGADPLGGDAVHLPASGWRSPPSLPLVGRSCHDAGELARLSTEDYVTLSPVYASASKPGHGPALGPSGAAVLAARPRSGRGGVRWLALGGVDRPARVAACLAAGACGVAVMGAVMRAPDPEALVRSLTVVTRAVHAGRMSAGPVAAGSVPAGSVPAGPVPARPVDAGSTAAVRAVGPAAPVRSPAAVRAERS